MPGKATIILAKPHPERGLVRNPSSESLRLAPKPQYPTASTSGSSSPSTSEPVPSRILKSKDEDRLRGSVSPGPTSSAPAFSLSSGPAGLLGSRDGESESGVSLFGPSLIAPPSLKIQIQQKSESTISGSSGSLVNGTTSNQKGEKATPTEANASSLDARLAPYPDMKGSVKLIDEALQWCDHMFEFLQDQCDFLVVGIVGLQGTGKSTIMSLLAGNQGFKTSRTGVFKPQSREQWELGEHCTKGIDIFITNHRLILLDVQPMLSASVMDHMIQFEKKFPSEYNSTENALEIQSLQIAAFLLTVCHTVILVQDWFTDPNMLRFIQSAEMLRPSALLPSQDGTTEDVEYCPHLVFVQNKCANSEFEPTKVKLMQEAYSSIFYKSKLKFRSPIGIGLGNIVPCLQPSTCGDPINLFLLPCKDTEDVDNPNAGIPEYNGHPGFLKLAKALRYQIASMPRSQMVPSTLTEKNWFHYSARTWETVKKSSLFMEYCRLLS